MDNFSESPINVQLGSIAREGSKEGLKLSENIGNTISNIWESNKPIIVASVIVFIGIMAFQEPFKNIGNIASKK
jgi:hypothetical protein